MGLLNYINEIKENMNGNDSFPLGKYDGYLVDIKRAERGGYEVYDFIYNVKSEDGKHAGKLTDTMFVNADEEKTGKQVAFHVVPFLDAGLVEASVVDRALEDLEGFFKFLVEHVDTTPVTVKLDESTYKGKTRRNVTLQSVNVDPAAGDDKDDLPF